VQSLCTIFSIWTHFSGLGPCQLSAPLLKAAMIPRLGPRALFWIGLFGLALMGQVLVPVTAGAEVDPTEWTTLVKAITRDSFGNPMQTLVQDQRSGNHVRDLSDDQGRSVLQQQGLNL
jgi:hypothetical protein